jgi:hypothetical protein
MAVDKNAQKNSGPKKVTNRNRPNRRMQNVPLGISPKCLKVHAPGFYRETRPVDLPPPRRDRTQER